MGSMQEENNSIFYEKYKSEDIKKENIKLSHIFVLAIFSILVFFVIKKYVLFFKGYFYYVHNEIKILILIGSVIIVTIIAYLFHKETIKITKPLTLLLVLLFGLGYFGLDHIYKKEVSLIPLSDVAELAINNNEYYVTYAGNYRKNVEKAVFKSEIALKDVIMNELELKAYNRLHKKEIIKYFNAQKINKANKEEQDKYLLLLNLVSLSINSLVTANYLTPLSKMLEETTITYDNNVNVSVLYECPCSEYFPEKTEGNAARFAAVSLKAIQENALIRKSDMLCLKDKIKNHKIVSISSKSNLLSNIDNYIDLLDKINKDVNRLLIDYQKIYKFEKDLTAHLKPRTCCKIIPESYRFENKKLIMNLKIINEKEKCYKKINENKANILIAINKKYLSFDKVCKEAQTGYICELEYSPNTNTHKISIEIINKDLLIPPFHLKPLV